MVLDMCCFTHDSELVIQGHNTDYAPATMPTTETVSVASVRNTMITSRSLRDSLQSVTRGSTIASHKDIPLSASVTSMSGPVATNQIHSSNAIPTFALAVPTAEDTDIQSLSARLAAMTADMQAQVVVCVLLWEVECYTEIC